MTSSTICGIYCIENVDTKKKYIGQSKDIHKRWSNHKYTLNANIHDNDYLQKAWNKYGEDKFIFYVLEECIVGQLNEKEIYYIDYFQSFNRQYGYNLRGGGGQLTGMTLELKERFIGANNPMYGKRHTEEAKQRIGNATKAAYERSGGWDTFAGHKHSDDTRRKMSESRQGAKHPRHRDIYCLELDMVFWGPSEAEKILGVSRGNISSCCLGKLKTAGVHPETGEKLHWFYLDDAIALKHVSNSVNLM